MKGLIQAIAKALDDAFGVDIYIDELEMGFDTPCFFIELNTSRKSHINLSRDRMQVHFTINFFAEDKKKKKPGEKGEYSKIFNTTAMKLYEVLDVFAGENRKYRSHDMNHKNHEDFMSFEFYVICHSAIFGDDEYMKTLFQDINLKYGSKEVQNGTGKQNGRNDE